MSAVGGTEGIVHIDSRKLGQCPREAGIVGLLLAVKPQVLQEQHFAGLQRLSHRLDIRTDAIGCHGHGLPQQFGKAHGDRSQAHLRIGLALRPAEVRSENYRSASIKQCPDRRQRHPDARVAGDGAPSRFVQGHIEVDAHEHPLAFHRELIKRSECHLVRTSVQSRSRNPLGRFADVKPRGGPPSRLRDWSIPTRCRTKTEPSPWSRRSRGSSPHRRWKSSDSA